MQVLKLSAQPAMQQALQFGCIGNAESTNVNAAARQSILDAGGVVRELDADTRQAWVDAMKPVWTQFVGDVGQDNIDAAQSINAGF